LSNSRTGSTLINAENDECAHAGPGDVCLSSRRAVFTRSVATADPAAVADDARICRGRGRLGGV